MLSNRSLFVVLALGCLLGVSSFTVFGQQSKCEQLTSPSDTLLLRRIGISHPGCVTCNNSIRDSEEKYLDDHVKERLTVESAYQQRIADEMKQALEDFWRGRGIDVEVNLKLTQLARAPRYAVLEFQVYRRY